MIGTFYEIKVGTEVVVRNDNTSTDIAIIHPPSVPYIYIYIYALTRYFQTLKLSRAHLVFKNRPILNMIFVCLVSNERKNFLRVNCKQNYISCTRKRILTKEIIKKKEKKKGNRKEREREKDFLWAQFI